MSVAITGIGIASALGADPGAVAAALATDTAGLTSHPPLSALADDRAGVVVRPDFRRFLRRRKDAKLMTRAARLALAASGAALGDWSGDRSGLGLFLGVGREPPDDGESEPSLVAACRDGQLDAVLLAGRGRDLYPPLLPLRTLPNMGLAHVAINLGIGGENGAWAGGSEASGRALAEAFWSVVEGRCPAALAGGADSLIDLGSARDRLRQGQAGAPGEAAAMLLLEPLGAARARGAPILAQLTVHGEATTAPPVLCAMLGDCGAAVAALEVVLAVSGVTLPGSGVWFSVERE